MVDGHVATFLRGHLPVSTPLASTSLDSLLVKALMFYRYVAIHAMQDDGHSHHDQPTMNGYSDSSQGKSPELRDTLAVVGGMLLPLLTHLGHQH